MNLFAAVKMQIILHMVFFVRYNDESSWGFKGCDIDAQYSSVLLSLAVSHGLITASLSEEETQLTEDCQVLCECVLNFVFN